MQHYTNKFNCILRTESHLSITNRILPPFLLHEHIRADAPTWRHPNTLNSTSFGPRRHLQARLRLTLTLTLTPTVSINWNHIAIRHHSLANWALFRSGINVSQLIKTRPTKQMTAASQDGILGEVQAYVTIIPNSTTQFNYPNERERGERERWNHNEFNRNSSPQIQIRPLHALSIHPILLLNHDAAISAALRFPELSTYPRRPATQARR